MGGHNAILCPWHHHITTTTPPKHHNSTTTTPVYMMGLTASILNITISVAALKHLLPLTIPFG